MFTIISGMSVAGKWRAVVVRAIGRVVHLQTKYGCKPGRRCRRLLLAEYGEFGASSVRSLRQIRRAQRAVDFSSVEIVVDAMPLHEALFPTHTLRPAAGSMAVSTTTFVFTNSSGPFIDLSTVRLGGRNARSGR